MRHPAVSGRAASARARVSQDIPFAVIPWTRTSSGASGPAWGPERSWTRSVPSGRARSKVGSSAAVS